MHTHKERVWVSLLTRRSAVKRGLSHLYKAVLGLCLPLVQLSGFFFHTWPTLGSSLRCTHTSQPRGIPKWRLLGGARLILDWSRPLTLTPRTSLVAQMVKHLPTMWEMQVRSLGREDPLEKEMATHSSTLAWSIPWTEDPVGLQSTGSQRVGHDWVTSLHFWLQRALLCV